MRIFLINLARRPDRLAAMTQALGRLGLRHTRIDARDARDADNFDGLFEDKGPLGEIPRGDKACLLSHRAAWAEFITSGESHAVILEDDVVLTPSAGQFLKNSGWIPPDVELIKLEHYGPKSQSVLLSDFRDARNGFRLARMHSRHTGAAAYILSRRLAEKLLTRQRFNLPVDHLLFNPNNSSLFATLAPFQLLPALARQRDFIGEKSDIEKTRVILRAFTPTYIKRELIRFGHDLKLLPRQLALAATGRAKFVRVETER